MTASVTGLVVAAGSSRRLGQPKQLLPFRDRTLLDATLDVARQAPFTQLMVTVGGAESEVRDTVDLDGFDVVDSVHHTAGCSSSIVSALAQVAPESAGIVMLLGDQPNVSVDAISALISEASMSPLGVCRYDDGIGHPFWFGRTVFHELSMLHGDKAVWKLIESGHHPVREVRISGPTPLDVDTWDDYEHLLATEAS